MDRSNDGSQLPPRLRRDINLGTLAELPQGSRGWRATLAEQFELLRADGHVAIQSWDQADEVIAAGFRVNGIARVLRPEEFEPLVRAHKAAGFDATTLHVGNSFERDAEMDALAGAMLDASARHAYPVYIETHRGTMTQDMRRTLDLVERFPDLRFNADLSHWYTGHELTYGGEFYERAARLDPVFERVRFMHARVGNPGCIQTGLDEPGDYIAHFRWMWTRCFEGFLRGAQPGDYLSFNAELLPQKLTRSPEPFWLHYAQPRRDLVGDAMGGEASDRYDDAERLWAMANECFAAAQAAIAHHKIGD